MTILLILIPAVLFLYVGYLILKALVIITVALIKLVFSHKEEIQLGKIDPQTGKVIW